MDPGLRRVLSKRLSWLLRHGANEAGVRMDAAGWVFVGDVLEWAQMSRAQLDEVVRTNTKRRIQVAGDRVRACQGHSTEGTPVTAEALEASWSEWTSDAPLFHGTRRASLEAIAREGLRPQKRTHVHLAAALESPVGKRAGVGVVLEVDPALARNEGAKVWEAPNGVLLMRRVPRAAIAGLHPISKGARKQAAALRALFERSK